MQQQQYHPEPEAYDLAEKAPLAATEQPQPPLVAIVSPHDGSMRTMSVWSTDVLGCFKHMPSMLDAMFCPHCQLSRQYNKYMTGDNSINWGACLSSFGADLAGVALCGVAVGSWAFAYIVRNRLRQRYSIVGDELSDILLSFFCHCCVVSQNFREMSVRGEFPSGSCCVDEPFSLMAPGVPVPIGVRPQ